MRELVRTIIGLSAVAVCVAAFFVYQTIAYYFAQQRCDAEGDVNYGIRIQMIADMFKEKFGRYPTAGELTNVMEITIGGELIATSRSGAARWYYDEKSGEVSLNIKGKYRVGPYTVIDLSETRFRRPTKVQETHFGRIETLDYSWENVRIDTEVPEITEIMTNWYMTNTFQKRE